MQKITGELAGLAQAAVTDARKLLVNARRAANRARAKAADLAAAGVVDAAAGRRRGRLVRAVNDLKDLIAATERIIEQARLRIRGIMPDGATRVVSLHDMQARPIAKGRLGKPVEFGYKAQFADNDDGIVLDHNVELGNPPDAPQLAPAIDRIIKQTGRMPRVVTADRGYGEAGIDRQLLDRGVGHVVIPRKGKPGKARREVEHGRAFRRHVKCGPGARAGSAASSGSTGGTAPGSTPSRVPGPGRGRASSPTTWSRSPTCPPRCPGDDNCQKRRCGGAARRLVRALAVRMRLVGVLVAGVRAGRQLESTDRWNHPDPGDQAADPDRCCGPPNPADHHDAGRPRSCG